MKTLYLDCGMGVSGPKLASALWELLPDADDFLSRLAAGPVSVEVYSCMRCGIRGTRLSIGPAVPLPAPDELLSALPPRVQGHARAVFDQLEAACGGTLDPTAWAEIALTCTLMDALHPGQVIASPVNAGQPSAAVSQLLNGLPAYGSAVESICTPMGIALLRHYATAFGSMPVMTVRCIGYGMGQRDFATLHCVRAMLGEADAVRGESLSIASALTQPPSGSAIGRADPETQLGDAPCPVCDTEEMFCLRMSDDAQSRVALGNALAAQYRYREATCAYRDALRIRPDDWHILHRLSAAQLTLLQTQPAIDGLRRCLQLGAEPRTLAYPLGFACFLCGAYDEAAQWFLRCRPCEDEMEIAVVYWHTICSWRAGRAPALLDESLRALHISHHTAYRLATSVFSGELSAEQALARLDEETSDLNYVISAYGVCEFLRHTGQADRCAALRRQLLARKSVWPCVSYLAAWDDARNE